jgi:hypothetical protein
MEIHFTEALAGTINVVLYAEFDNVIEIVLIHLSRTVIESHITANITCVFKVGL